MDQNLRGLFERALDDEPMPPGDLARAAMADGTRLRRRRRLLGGAATGVSLAVVAGAALHLAGPAVPPPAPAAAACSTGVDHSASSVSIFLPTDVTDAQRAAVDAVLRDDERVRTYRYEGHEEAFERFKVLWRDDPHMTASVSADSLAESFRVQMVRPEEFAAFRADLGRLDGVEEIIGSTCP